ncbi:MAG: rhodanese-like domain-containing protein [Planctomycetales bacterium]|nr:rhodanese-like domain-containing protein [Planctomycetales bacterium]
MAQDTIRPEQLYQLCQTGKRIDLIDVRTPAEFQGMHAIIAKNVPLDQLDCASIMNGRSQDEPLYIICLSGARGTKACDQFRACGFTNVVNVEGGTKAWESANLPLQRGKQVISLERQVRIAAGFLTMCGAIVSYFNPYFAIVPAAMGAGLMFAGITDSCAMGMFLAKMPWNQVATGGSATCSANRAA